MLRCSRRCSDKRILGKAFLYSSSVAANLFCVTATESNTTYFHQIPNIVRVIEVDRRCVPAQLQDAIQQLPSEILKKKNNYNNLAVSSRIGVFADRAEYNNATQ